MKKVFYGWWVVLATSLIHFWGPGTFFYSFTAFFNPIVDEFGWSYASTSLAASLRSIEGGIASPVVGWAVDRYGAGRLLFAGSLLSGLGFVLFSRIQSLWAFYLVFIFLSVGSSLLFPVAGWTAVANWFDKHRGTAMGIVSGAAGAGGILVYGVNWLIGLYGWRSTLVIIAIGMWVIGIPCSLVVGLGRRSAPGESHEAPETPAAPPLQAKRPSPVQPAPANRDFTAIQALKTRAFWVLAVVVIVSAAGMHAVMVHTMPYLASVHLGRQTASFVTSLLVLVSIVGRFGMGWLGNRMNKKYLLVAGLLLQGMGLVVLDRTRTLWQAIGFTLLFGPGYGGMITLRLTLQAEYFGSRAYGTISGAMMALMVIGTMASPLLAGMAYDVYGSYTPAWLFMAGLSLAGIPLALTARPPGGR